MSKKLKKPEILLIEDNDGDAVLAQEAILYNKSDIELTRARNGSEAFQMLTGTKSMPDLILLDLNLPGMNGIEILQLLKSDPKTSSIPVIIFSMSNNEADISLCYQLKANSFITKPLDLKAFFEVFKTIEKYLADLK
jgi:CheY-like chemotaxis protein